MEDDLPLIEISGADDSLLQSNADENISLFDCSPFQLTRSRSPRLNPLGEMMGNQSVEKPSGSIGKENVNSLEATKLSLEPQTMKKKKRGGFNLRKSLAWNRAFFTEEGVLDSAELSLLSGNPGETCRDRLASINEDGSSSSVRGSGRKAKGLVAVEKKLFKEASPRNEWKNRSGGLSSKIGSPTARSPAKPSPARSPAKPSFVRSPAKPSFARSPAKPSPVKKDANKIGSKRSGCPRPIASSALKRPANVKMTKGASEETKIAKAIVPKPDSVPVSATSKRAAGENKLKGNYAPPPVVNAQKRVGLQSSSRNKSSQVDAKSGLPSRSLTARSSAEARKNTGSLPSESHSSADKVLAIKIGSKVIKEPENKSAVYGAINHNAKSTKIPSIPQPGSSVGGSTQIAPPPPMVKPSGLRMPSPSLQFFGSSKESSLPRRSQFQSEIPNPRKIASLKPVSGKPPAAPVIQAVNVMPAFGNDSASSNRAGCSLPSRVSTVPCENKKVDLKASSERQLNVKVACTSNSNETTNNQQFVHNDAQQQVEDKKCQSYGNKLLEHNGSEKQVENDDDDMQMEDDQVSLTGADLKTSISMSHHTKQLAEDRQHQPTAENLCIYPESQSANLNSHCMHGSSDLQDNQESSLETGDVKLRELVDTTKPCSLEGDHTITDSQQPHVHDILESGPSEESHIVNDMDCDNICSKERDQSASEPGKSDSQAYPSDEKQEKGVGNDEVSKKSDLSDSQLQSFKPNLSLMDSKDFSNSLVADYQHVLDISNDMPVQEPEDPNPCIVVGRASQDNCCGSQLMSSFLQEQSSPQEHQAERVDVFKSEVESSSDCGPDMIDMDCMDSDDDATAACAEAKSKCGSDNTISVLTVPDTVATNVSQNSAYLGIEELESLQSSSHLNSPGVDDATDLESKESKQGDLLGNIHGSVPNLQPEENISSCDQGNLMLLLPSPGVQHNVNGESTEEPEQMESCSLETDKASQEDNQIPETYDYPFPVKGNCFEENSIVDADDVCDVRPEKVVESPHDEFQLDQTEQSNEEGSAGVINATERLLTGDRNVLPLDGSNNLGASAEESKSSVLVDKSEEPVEKTEVQITGFIGKEVSGYVEIEPSAENHETFVDEKLKNDCKLCDQATSMEFDLYSSSEAQIPGTETDSKAFCPAEESRFLVKPDEPSCGDIVQEKEVSLLNNNTLTEAETNISQDGSTLATAMQNDLNASSPTEAKDESSHTETNHDTKPGNLVIKPPPCAVPFSDEWLAAFEAAGEEILTMKGGAVQNSPQDKAPPEPSPWSPVRKKNNQGIGPFDCTKKFTNPNILPPESS